jgi:hypothetical protein
MNIIFIVFMVLFHSEELRHLYSSPNIIRIIKARRIRWAGHVAWKGKKRNGRQAKGKKLGRQR